MLGQPEIGRVFPGEKPEDVMRTWAAYLADYSDEEFERGMRHVSGLRFMPRLGEFAQACRPCLDAEYAWHEACAGLRMRDAGKRGEWSHPAVWRAAVALSMEVRSGDFMRNRGVWTFTLKRELEAGFGEDVPVPAARLEYVEAKAGPPSMEVRSRLERLMAESREFTRLGRAARKADKS